LLQSVQVRFQTKRADKSGKVVANRHVAEIATHLCCAKPFLHGQGTSRTSIERRMMSAFGYEADIHIRLKSIEA